MDKISKLHHSWNMSRIRSKDSVAEKTVRSVMHRLGYRFRLHVKDLPGKPDLVLAKHKLVIFVHGCFWHRHENCKLSTIPKTNRDFWLDKFESNVRRDLNNYQRLEELGWRVAVIWECSTKNLPDLLTKIDEIFHEGISSLGESFQEVENGEIEEVISRMRNETMS